MSLEKTKQWFEQAVPKPTIEQATIWQLGCHMEEFNLDGCEFYWLLVPA